MTDIKEPKILFKNLKGFPAVKDGTMILTVEFLEASREIVTVIESFGRLFTPVIKDMQGNIDKLTKSYQKDEVKFVYLENLILENINVDNNYAGNSLLWLKRALQLICKFFENILNDRTSAENLREHLQSAYESTLKPYHGWFVQNTVSVIYRWVPNRSQLIGNGYYHDENIKVLEQFLPTMELHLIRIDALLKDNNLDDCQH